MAMGAVTATDLDGNTHAVQFQEKCDFTQIVKMAVTTGLASTDVITGPTIPAGCSLVDCIVDLTDIDGATSLSWTLGRSGSAAAFIGTNTTGRSAGIARMDVAAALGYTPTSDTPVILTITATAGTPVAGTIKIGVTCTRNP
jgi:hypothetical protein